MVPLKLGNKNQFGEGGFTAKTNQPGSRVVIGNNGRYLNNSAVFGKTELQSGSQILGNITLISCKLSEGGSYQEPDPNLRAGLLKGSVSPESLLWPKVMSFKVRVNSRKSRWSSNPHFIQHMRQQAGLVRDAAIWHAAGIAGRR